MMFSRQVSNQDIHTENPPMVSGSGMGPIAKSHMGRWKEDCSTPSMNVENVLELLESLNRQHKGTGGGILLRKNGTTTEEGDEETAEKMVGRMLQFQQASSPLVNVALGLLGVQTPLVCDTVSRFLVDSLVSVLRVRNFSAFDLR
ncbi:unnamed protein product [Sphagnum balticum]